MSIAKYLKTAFVNRWNLLALAGAAGFGLVSGRPDVVLPIALAVELGYLAFVGTHPKFQKFVDMQEAAGLREAGQQKVGVKLEHIMRALPKGSLRRYRLLRSRCQELRKLAARLKAPGAGAQLDLEHKQVKGLEELLWVFLRLLFTENTMREFLKATDADRIQKDIAEAEARLQRLDGEPESPHTLKIRRTVADNLKTSQQRMANYRRAEGNFEFVQLELDRLENKINSLAELAVNRQEPDYITSEVSEMASSVLHTEQTIAELDFLTHLGGDSQAPPLLAPKEVLIIE